MAMKPIYYRWGYSPSSRDVQLSHNQESHPADISFHSELAHRLAPDAVFGYAYRLDNGGWKVTDADHKPEEDIHHRVTIENAINKYEESNADSKSQ